MECGYWIHPIIYYDVKQGWDLISSTNNDARILEHVTNYIDPGTCYDLA